MYVSGGLNWVCGTQQQRGALWCRFQKVTSMLCPPGCKKWARAEELCVHDAGTHSVLLHLRTGSECPGSAVASADRYCPPGTPSETNRTNRLQLNIRDKYSSLYELTLNCLRQMKWTEWIWNVCMEINNSLFSHIIIDS